MIKNKEMLVIIQSVVQPIMPIIPMLQVSCDLIVLIIIFIVAANFDAVL